MEGRGYAEEGELVVVVELKPFDTVRRDDVRGNETMRVNET